MSESDSIRIDKWLWAARFFKTRGLASEAIKGGKVEINGARAKPAKAVQAGDRLRIRRGPYLFEVIVEAVSPHRGPAAVAATLYRETPASIEARERLAEQLRASALSQPQHRGRPTKRDRRRIVRFTREED